MGARTGLPLGLVPEYPGRQALHREAEAFEHPKQQRVVLEAIAAAPALDDLVEQRLRVELDPAPEQDIHILERDARRMPGDDPTQCRERRLARPGIADAGEIGGKLGIPKHLGVPVIALGGMVPARPAADKIAAAAARS